MIYFILPSKEISLHLGQSIRPEIMKQEDFKGLTVQADGNELYAIKVSFQGLRYCKTSRVVVFRGDDALCIADHWNSMPLNK